MDRPLTPLLFDIDHTLTGEDENHFKATLHALKEVYDLEEPYLDDQLHGHTQFHLLYLIATGNQIDHEVANESTSQAIDSLTKKYLALCNGSKLGQLLGVQDALTELQKHYPLGILTGNTETIAHTKLSRAGLASHFSFGGYNTSEIFRHHLYTKAMIDFSHAHDLPAEQLVSPVIIGDTPHDIAAAKKVGASSVGVASGIFNRLQLMAAGADLVIDSMQDFPQIIEFINTK